MAIMDIAAIALLGILMIALARLFWALRQLNRALARLQALYSEDIPFEQVRSTQRAAKKVTTWDRDYES